MQGLIFQRSDDLVRAGIREQVQSGVPMLVRLGDGLVEQGGVGIDRNGGVRAAVAAVEPFGELGGYDCLGEGVGLGSGPQKRKHQRKGVLGAFVDVAAGVVGGALRDRAQQIAREHGREQQRVPVASLGVAGERGQDMRHVPEMRTNTGRGGWRRGVHRSGEPDRKGPVVVGIVAGQKSMSLRGECVQDIHNASNPSGFT